MIYSTFLISFFTLYKSRRSGDSVPGQGVQGFLGLRFDDEVVAERKMIPDL